MAVNSSKKSNYKMKKYNKNNNKSFQTIAKENNIINNNIKKKKKSNNTTSKKKLELKQISIEKKEIISNKNEETIIEKKQEADISKEIKETKNDNIIQESIVKKGIIKINNKLSTIIIISLLIILFVYILLPKISLKGDRYITIGYDEEYIEPGYKANFIFKNITKKIKVDSNVVNGKIGSYKIIYSFKIGLVNFKKIRIINIVDNKKPEVLLDDEITICPNDDISKIKYEVYDEYDGDITNKAISNYINNKLIITASDNSNNKVIKEVIIKKDDSEKPVIKLKGSEIIYLNYGSSYYEPGYEATDNCDGNITDKVIINGKVDNLIGTYKITYTVSDNANNKTEVTRTVIIRNNNMYNSGSISSGTIYLTFDDGPNSGTTNIILDVLKEENIKATFFVTCNGPDNLIKRIYDEGHTVALHTATHDYSYVYSSVENYFNDLNRVSTRVKNITGIESKIIRFPGGSSNTISRRYQTGIMTTLTSMVLEKGYRYFDWNIDAMDASSAKSSSDVYNNVINNLSKSRSNVVLMHDTKITTRDALRNIIKYGKSQGYKFEKIDMNTYMVRHSVNN